MCTLIIDGERGQDNKEGKMKFIRRSSKKDPVITYRSEDGFFSITKRPSVQGWVLKQHSLFDVMGEEIGRFATYESAAGWVNRNV